MTLRTQIQESVKNRDAERVRLEKEAKKEEARELARRYKKLNTIMDQLTTYICRDVEAGFGRRTMSDTHINQLFEYCVRDEVLDWLKREGVKVDVCSMEVNQDYSGYGARYETVYTTIFTYPVKGEDAVGRWGK